MSRVYATITAARRRALLADLTAAVGSAMLWGAAAGAALVLADRLVGLGVHWALLLGTPPAIGAALGAARAWARRAGPLAAAGMVDDALALRDRLTNGLTLAGARGQDPVFVELALRESDRAAAAAEPRRAIAVHFGRAWHGLPALILAGVAIAILVPSMDLLGRAAARDRAAIELARRERVSGQLAAAAEAVRHAPPAPTTQADATATVPDPRSAELERIREELEQGRISPQDAAARAVQELQAIAEREEREAESAASSQRATANALEGLPRSAWPEAAPEAGGIDDVRESALTRAVREGDLAAARDAANQLLRPRQTMDPAAREQLAEDLRRLAEDLEQLERQEAERAARQAAAEARQRAEPTGRQEPDPREDSPRTGETRSEQDRASTDTRPTDAQRQPDEREQKPGEQGNQQGDKQGKPGEQTQQGQREQKPGEQGDQQGTPGEQTQQGQREQKPGEQGDQQGDKQGKPGEQTQQGQREQKPGERSQQGERSEGSQRIDAEQLQRELEREGMSPEDARRAAEQIAERSQRDSAQNASRDQRRELAQRLRDAAESLKPGETQPADARPRPTADEQPHDSPQPQEGEQPQAGEQEPGQQPAPGQQPEPGDKQPAPAEQPKPGQEGQQPQGPGQQAHRNQDVPQGTSPDQPGRQPAAEQAPPPGGERNVPGDIPEPTPQAVERLAEQLQRMARDGDRQQQSAEAAKRAREQAEEIARGLSDDQLKRLEQWAGALARQRPDVMEELAGQSPPPDERESPPRDGDSGGTGEARPDGTATPAPSGPRRTEIVDARPREGAGRGSERDHVVAEWLAPPREGDAPSAIAPRQRLLEAARSAQKAVDDRAIPSRYDRLVQRYFRRLPERVEEAAAEQQGPSGRTLP
ncbi:MAG: hypothetical protein KF869_08540 [Phycisphaeraceae bacterium]|nr:hypothetical protein [Phycisphaeraceae bacterium]